MKKVFTFMLLLVSFTSVAQFEPYVPSKKETNNLQNQKIIQDSVYYAKVDEAECLIKAGRSLNMAILMPAIGAGVFFIASNSEMTPEDLKPYVYVAGGLGVLGLIFYLRGTGFITIAGKSMKYKQLKKTSLGLTYTENGVAFAIRF